MTLKPKRLLLNLLLAAEDETLTARGAIAACALFGLRENSVRVALARLSSEGLVESPARGLYRLGPQATGLARDVAAWRGVEQRLVPWDGGWVGVYCAALGRSDRAALRRRERALKLAGFAALERDLFVRADNLAGGAAALRDRLGGLGLEAQALVFRLEGLDPQHEARARTLWDGAGLERGYRQAREQMAIWLERVERLDLDAAARESFVIGDRAIRQRVFDPMLPEPLVDVAERRAFTTTLLHFDETGRRLWRRLYDASVGARRPAHGAARPAPH